MLIIILIIIPFSVSTRYLYEVIAFNNAERQMLYFMHIRSSSVTFINGISNEAAIPIKVIVKNDTVPVFEETLQCSGLQYNYISKVSMSSYKDFIQNMYATPHNITKTFLSWDNILLWINSVVKRNMYFQRIVIAKTYERRDVVMVKVSVAPNNPAVVIVGGEEGIDWMSSAVILNLINDMISPRNKLGELLNNFDFYIVPILNPDGFVYSKKKDRFWTKNRKQLMYTRTCDRKVVGVNLVRNWFLSEPMKKSDDMCNAIYFGSKSLSEEETQGLSYILNNIALDLIAFINIRSFSNFITIPYGVANARSNNQDIVMTLLKYASRQLQKIYHVNLPVGTTDSMFYNFTGTAADWVKIKLNTPLVYTLYLNNEESLLQEPNDIQPLSDQLETLLNYTLLISKQLYGPLFNSCVKLFQTYVFYFILFNLI